MMTKFLIVLCATVLCASAKPGVVVGGLAPATYAQTYNAHTINHAVSAPLVHSAPLISAPLAYNAPILAKSAIASPYIASPYSVNPYSVNPYIASPYSVSPYAAYSSYNFGASPYLF